MFCASCGTELPAGTRFCGQCGSALEPLAAAAAAAASSPSPQPLSPAGAAAAPARSAGPMPPQMHWAILLLLTYITFGVFLWIWAFKEAGFVTKLDPSSKAVKLLKTSLICVLAMVVVPALLLASGASEMVLAGFGFTMLLMLVVWVAWLMAVFGMRSSLVRYYNTVEPIGLRLSGVMTFFFNFLYFQYHFSRIAAWKKSGQ